METHDERQAREQKHLKKQTKTKTFKKGLTPAKKEKNWKNKLMEGFNG